jgi:hypothetical protein
MFGTPGLAFMVTSAVGNDVQPTAFVTVNVYIPGSSPVTVRVAPLAVIVAPPGLIVIVQKPDTGNPLRLTLPVGTV